MNNELKLETKKRIDFGDKFLVTFQLDAECIPPIMDGCAEIKSLDTGSRSGIQNCKNPHKINFDFYKGLVNKFLEE